MVRRFSYFLCVIHYCTRHFALCLLVDILPFSIAFLSSGLSRHWQFYSPSTHIKHVFRILFPRAYDGVRLCQWQWQRVESTGNLFHQAPSGFLKPSIATSRTTRYAHLESLLVASKSDGSLQTSCDGALPLFPASSRRLPLASRV